MSEALTVEDQWPDDTAGSSDVAPETPIRDRGCSGVPGRHNLQGKTRASECGCRASTDYPTPAYYDMAIRCLPAGISDLVENQRATSAECKTIRIAVSTDM